MKFNKQRRQLLKLSCLVLSGLYLPGCSKSDDSAVNTTNSASLPEINTQSPVINTHPIDKSVAEGSIAIFSVIASGNSVKYQWQKNGEVIPGATNAKYSTPPVTQDDEGAKFTVTVSNSNGSAISNVATLVIFLEPITVDSLTITIDSNFITTDRI